VNGSYSKQDLPTNIYLCVCLCARVRVRACTHVCMLITPLNLWLHLFCSSTAWQSICLTKSLLSDGGDSALQP